MYMINSVKMFCLPKNIPPNILKTSGNTGLNFNPLDCYLPEEPQCSLILEENSDVYIIREETIDQSGTETYLDIREDALMYVDCMSE